MAQYAARGVHGRMVQLMAERILTGELAEGATLDLLALQREFGVSRTTIREALRVLAAKGLVDARPKRGTFVRSRADWNLFDSDLLRWQSVHHAQPGLFDDLSELCSIIAPGAATLAAARATEDDLVSLEAALAGVATAGADAPAAFASAIGFLRALLAASHNELLARMDVVIETCLAEWDPAMHPVHAAGDLVPLLRAVVNAIRRRDPEQSALAMRTLPAMARHDAVKPHARGEQAHPMMTHY
ncbi:FadR/GntR family transcriptional regulator [Streptomyces sp. NPDC020917]|uniref:FadR/GntR family transcriptional regulator n=1 Tax=Streptomyces sp. NPDC020917 TaxID=3365102 RepID=UPI00379052DA